MGLLDEAIREHLELKRRGGADPTVVEREEQEALASGPLEDELAGLDGQADELGNEHEKYHGPEDQPVGAEDGQLPAAEWGERPAASFVDLVDTGQQDTAELDMRAAMDADAGPGGGAAPGVGVTPHSTRGGGWAKPYAGRPSEEDPLEWELPGDRERESPPQSIPGQERLSFE